MTKPNKKKVEKHSNKPFQTLRFSSSKGYQPNQPTISNAFNRLLTEMNAHRSTNLVEQAEADQSAENRTNSVVVRINL